MKILAISIPVCGKYNAVNSPRKNQSGPILGMTSNGCDTVSFKNRNPYCNPNAYKDVRDIPGLPCACCGEVMIPNSVYDDFKNNVLYYPAGESLDKIERTLNLYSRHSPEGRLEAYNFLREKAKQYPKKNIVQLLNVPKIREEYNNLPDAEKEEAAFIVKESRGVSHDFQYVVDNVEKFKPKLHENEELIYNRLRSYLEMYPKSTIQEMLNKKEINNAHLLNLLIKQNVLLKQVSNISRTMSMESQAKINVLVNDAEKMFCEESADVMQKRSRVINSFYTCAKNIPETKAMAKIIKTIEALPSSKDDIDAFMVKYAKRSSNETIEVILGRSRNTFEHIKPNHRVGDRGPREKSNGICLCSKCNQERQRTPYKEFILKHPEMVANTQKQIDMIIDFINKGLLIGYDKYPEGVKHSLDKESDSAIAINTDKLAISVGAR